MQYQDSSGTSPDAKRGLALTFAVLGNSHDPRADALLAQALTELDARIQVNALEAMMVRPGSRTGLRDAISSLHLLSNPAVNFMVEHIDRILPALRELAGSPQVQTRLNVMELASRPNQVRLAYLLVQGVDDPDERVAQRALSALERLTRRYHQQEEAARLGRVDFSHDELEARRFALIDPLLSRLSPGRGQTAEEDGATPRLRTAGTGIMTRLLELSMGLDSRTDDLLYRIYANPHDARSRMLGTVLAGGSSSQVVSFVVDMLRSRNPERSGRGLALVERRREAGFVRQLLATDRLFTDPMARAALKGLKHIPWLEPYAEVDDGTRPRELADPEITELLSEDMAAVRAIHLLVLSGAPAVDILRGLSRHVGAHAARELAGTAIEALEAHRPTEQISMALLGAERDIEAEAAARAKEGNPAQMKWARPGTGIIPRDAFRQFFENYDRLGPEEKELASATLRRLEGDLNEKLKEVLSSVEAGVRLRALRIVTELAREREVEEVLLELMEDPDERVRATVVKTLGIVESEPAVRALLTAVTDMDRRVVANAVEAIETSGLTQMVGLVRILAGHANNRIRANAVKALIQMRASGAQDYLQDMLASPSEMMRLSATWVLGEVNIVGGQERLKRLALSDPSERVRDKAKAILEGNR